jgi:hypothetical protein
VKQRDIESNEYWEEILESVDMDFLPIEYVSFVIVKFSDGRVWEIDLAKQSKESEDVEETLERFFEEFEDTIENVDFRLNIDKLKKDIGRRTRRFLKLNK